MKSKRSSLVTRPAFVLISFSWFVSVLLAQTTGPDSSGNSISAIGYPVDGGSTKIDLMSTGRMPGLEGQAEVEARRAVTKIDVEIHGLKSPTSLGSEFLTYVLWAVSPEGSAVNLGEILFDNNGNNKLKTTTQLASFSLFVTAEPYAAVRQPSELLILENALRKGTKGRIYPVNNYQLMKRSQYQKLGNPLALSLDLKNVPLEMYEARNSVEIARSRGADKYAPDVFSKAEGGLKLAEQALARKASQKEIRSLAQQTAEFSEDARALTAERQEQERIAAQRDAAAATAKARAEAKASAEAAEAKRRADEEANRQAELAAARQAQLKAEAAANEAQLRAEAAETKRKTDEEARHQAEVAAALRDREEAAKAEAYRAKRAAEELRAQLLEQFNRILETRDTARGLVVTMADVLFDTGKYDVRPGTREQLAKLSGILLAHPGLQLEVEGHTDSTGSDELNQKLSEQRASAVREYLVAQGLASDAVASRGFGKTMPVASNDSAAGRQKNRRVELIVSGDVIGVKIGQ
jgi:outer membrane protein OmpA-like peptidoglycan-associated protein